MTLNTEPQRQVAAYSDSVADAENVIKLHRIPRHQLKPVANLSNGFVTYLLLGNAPSTSTSTNALNRSYEVLVRKGRRR